MPTKKLYIGGRCDDDPNTIYQLNLAIDGQSLTAPDGVYYRPATPEENGHIVVKQTNRPCKGCKGGQVRWLGIRWHGVPWPKRIRMCSPYKVTVLKLPGCGCIVKLKAVVDAWKRA